MKASKTRPVANRVGAKRVQRCRARTGEELLAFFRASPVVGIDLKIDRDKSAGRVSALWPSSVS